MPVQNRSPWRRSAGLIVAALAGATGVYVLGGEVLNPAATPSSDMSPLPGPPPDNSVPVPEPGRLEPPAPGGDPVPAPVPRPGLTTSPGPPRPGPPAPPETPAPHNLTFGPPVPRSHAPQPTRHHPVQPAQPVAPDDEVAPR